MIVIQYRFCDLSSASASYRIGRSSGGFCEFLDTESTICYFYLPFDDCGDNQRIRLVGGYVGLIRLLQCVLYARSVFPPVTGIFYRIRTIPYELEYLFRHPALRLIIIILVFSWFAM